MVNFTSSGNASPNLWDAGRVQIPLYSAIFLLAVGGNSLVILTLAVHQRMRTITNVFLLNLAVSDLLLGVLCMPFTLIGALLRDFVFGEFMSKTMCNAIPFFMSCSVAVSAWTLVAISVERYYAICHPLRSRRWQTLSHAYHMIAIIWSGSLACMLPIAWLSELKPTNKVKNYERFYNLLLDVLLLVLPLLALAVTYSLIIRSLRKGMELEHSMRQEDGASGGCESSVYLTSKASFITRRCRLCQESSSATGAVFHSYQTQPCHHQVMKHPPTGLRRSNAEKSLSNKRRVIKMLCAVVLEFFVCWTPLYIINTIALFKPEMIYHGLGYTGITFFQLLAYTSSCCNPITYCFMNTSFRKSFLTLFRCRRRFRTTNLSDVSASECGITTRSQKWLQDAPSCAEHL
ncbi:cholecystokinin receptor-like [Anabrus simplex]|uniref:cholecystokinin receptor-like n=1 Tax=Anabrus simplex TaxID=316456 RepID=UPI0035A37158